MKKADSPRTKYNKKIANERNFKYALKHHKIKVLNNYKRITNEIK